MRQATIKLSLFFASILFITHTVSAQVGDLTATTTSIRSATHLNSLVTDSLPKSIVKATVSAELHESTDATYDDYSSSSIVYGLLSILLIGVILNVFVIIQAKLMYN